MKKDLSVRTIVAIGIGSAVFIILSRFADIPSGIPNTSIKTSYAFLAIAATLFGPIAGGLIGLIGHTLNDMLSYGSAWWSWIVVSGFVGFFIGMFNKKILPLEEKMTVKQIVFFNISQALTQAIGFGAVAPILDIVIYKEPANKVFIQGLVAGVANIITVGIIGTAILIAYAKTRVSSNSLDKE